MVTEVDMNWTYDHFIEVKADMCRVIHTHTSRQGSTETQVICCNVRNCKKRTGGSHNTLSRTGSNLAKPGWYEVIRTKTAKLVGGKPGTRKSIDQVQKIVRESNERAYQLSQQVTAEASMGLRAAFLASRVKREQTTPGKSTSTSLRESPASASHASLKKKFGYIPESALKNSRYTSSVNEKPIKMEPTKMEPTRIEPGTTTSTSGASDATSAATLAVLRQMQQDFHSIYARLNDYSDQMAKMEQNHQVQQDKLQAEISSLHQETKEQQERMSQPKSRSSSHDSDSNDSYKKKKNLYAIAKGNGGVACIGLYRENWYDIKFIVDNHSNARYERVRSEKEGKQYIQNVCNHTGEDPNWLKWDRFYYYPKLEGCPSCY